MIKLDDMFSWLKSSLFKIKLNDNLYQRRQKCIVRCRNIDINNYICDGLVPTWFRNLRKPLLSLKMAIHLSRASFNFFRPLFTDWATFGHCQAISIDTKLVTPKSRELYLGILCNLNVEICYYAALGDLFIKISETML